MYLCTVIFLWTLKVQRVLHQELVGLISAINKKTCVAVVCGTEYEICLKNR